MSGTGSPVDDDLGTVAQRERRQRILDAATSLASEGGFERVQMRAVAVRAQVALGTLYRYFPSKIHLLVSVLGEQFAHAADALVRTRPPGRTAADRVVHVLARTTGSLQREPHLTEALTRAYVFADASVAREIEVVTAQVTRMLLTGLRSPDDPRGVGDPDEHEVAMVKVIGDVWLASLVQWVTGRLSAADVESSMDVAVRLLLRGD
ncbi:MAG: TetR/AcrR family transcriptional regulator [Nocardioidaceae bacterium]|nr:TetR/AcrR family transcriptional regulator [Nocardioidaceae bacterium]NUS50128.1 TetR/AcrR family transcriptional regulator [Nocardioidaceae bacterium]